MSKEYIAKLEAENAYLRRKEGIPGDVQIGPPPPINERAYQNPMSAACGLKQESPEETIDYMFTFHDDPDKTPHYIEIREAAKQFAKVLIRHCPSCADRTTAIRRVREAVMTANAAVALNGRGL